MAWVTEITHVSPLSHFVDEQRYGPYKMWHHQHFFREIPGGVEVEDIVDYILPFHFIGKIVHRLLVRERLSEIFDFRAKVLTQRFGTIR